MKKMFIYLIVVIVIGLVLYALLLNIQKNKDFYGEYNLSTQAIDNINKLEADLDMLADKSKVAVGKDITDINKNTENIINRQDKIKKLNEHGTIPDSTSEFNPR